MRVLAAVAAFTGLALVVPVVGRWRFDTLVDRDTRRLFSNSSVGVGPDQRRARWNTLPEPVRRYLRFAVREGTPEIRAVRLQHDGLFRTKPSQRWLPIKGEQYFTTAMPGFVWHATVRPLPFVWIEARDCLMGGRGQMLVKLQSTVSVANAGGPAVDQGATLRWLAEAAWFPYGFVGNAIAWEPIDKHSARATIRLDEVPAAAVFEVDDQGMLVRMHAQRYRDIGGGNAVLTPWTGQYGDFRECGGFRIPTSVEVSWELPDGTFSYARFHVTRIEYNVSIRF